MLRNILDGFQYILTHLLSSKSCIYLANHYEARLNLHKKKLFKVILMNNQTHGYRYGLFINFFQVFK